MSFADPQLVVENAKILRSLLRTVTLSPYLSQEFSSNIPIVVDRLRVFITEALPGNEVIIPLIELIFANKLWRPELVKLPPLFPASMEDVGRSNLQFLSDQDADIVKSLQTRHLEICTDNNRDVTYLPEELKLFVDTEITSLWSLEHLHHHLMDQHENVKGQVDKVTGHKAALKLISLIRVSQQNDDLIQMASKCLGLLCSLGIDYQTLCSDFSADNAWRDYLSDDYQGDFSVEDEKAIVVLSQLVKRLNSSHLFICQYVGPSLSYFLDQSDEIKTLKSYLKPSLQSLIRPFCSKK